jgi:hypothetical protein
MTQAAMCRVIGPPGRRHAGGLRITRVARPAGLGPLV